ncbi:MAG: hypothetical protein CR986_08365 [Ignavibacteriae bacterium]|nr:MAG: hypothetical protein CR986_08365 [Ignavibacteriota bacterium]
MNIKTLLIILLVLLLVTSCSSKKENDIENQKYKTELSSYAKDYMISLKKVLIKNMQEGGPIQAVNICSDTASEMTQNFSEKNNVTIKRFSFKNRNISNVPDEMEKSILNEFQKLSDKGELTGKTFKLNKSKVNGKTTITFIKPIVIEAPCLNCHGNETQVDKKVAELLKNKYPADKAVGYKVGDLRGAISVTKVL